MLFIQCFDAVCLLFVCCLFMHGSVWCVAMAIGLGGNPYGPAGTGKTESVKALGGLFGRQVLVFNCDEVKIHSHYHSKDLSTVVSNDIQITSGEIQMLTID